MITINNNNKDNDKDYIVWYIISIIIEIIVIWIFISQLAALLNLSILKAILVIICMGFSLSSFEAIWLSLCTLTQRIYHILKSRNSKNQYKKPD